MNLKQLVVMSAVSVATGCKSSQQHTSTSFDEYPVYEGEWVEMAYTPASTRFSLWAPSAQEVRVLLYEKGQGGSAYRMVKMAPASDGLWQARVDEDLKGKFYTFNVKIDDVWQGDTPGLMAKAVGVNGDRAAVIDWKETNPEGWNEDKRPPLKRFSDMVIYELHHRDFSIDTISGIRNRGKFLALAENGTTNGQGASTGIDHLRELGVTHVHILPSFDYASVDETTLQDNVYNWGYDPVNYNVPEGSYSTDPYDPACRIREFKQMVMALHQAGIRVILDVVYNHVADAASSPFELTVPGYFFRMKEDGSFADGSGCGNETASEKEMMRRYIVESVCRWAREYHIDGFRFDLMGIHDIETMNAVRSALDKIDPDILVYGEGWAASAPSYCPDSLAMKAAIWRMPGIAAFSDELRDALRGPFSDDNKAGFLGGEPGLEESVKFGIVGAVQHPGIDYSKVNYSDTCWSNEPTQMISYISCHDDMCLRDRLTASVPEASEAELLKMDKLGQTAVFTSQGIPYIFAGEEIFRTKQGVHNSYNSPDSINAIDWSFKNRYADLYEYCRGLIALRKAHPAFRLGDADLIRKHLEFMEVPEGVVAFRLTGHAGGDPCEEIIVILNSLKKPVTIDVSKDPQDSRDLAEMYTYTVFCSGGKVSADGLGTVSGPTVTAGAQEALIIGRP